MFESIFLAVMGIITSAWFAPLLTFIFGSLAGQMPMVQRLWGVVMGVREKLDQVEELIDTIDAVLKANGVIPADAPKLAKDEIKAVLDGSMTVGTLAIAHKARLKKF